MTTISDERLAQLTRPTCAFYGDDYVGPQELWDALRELQSARVTIREQAERIERQSDTITEYMRRIKQQRERLTELGDF